MGTQPCAPTAPVIHGDARLTVQQEDQASFDVLVIDAFSSDSILIHLITVEAIEMYLGKLKPDGLRVFHISNRHLSLSEVLKANMDELAREARRPLSGLRYDDLAAGADEDQMAPSKVVIMSADPLSIASVNSMGHGRDLATFGDVAAWTDDYSNVVSAIVHQHRLK